MSSPTCRCPFASLHFHSFPLAPPILTADVFHDPLDLVYLGPLEEGIMGKLPVFFDGCTDGKLGLRVSECMLT